MPSHFNISPLLQTTPIKDRLRAQEAVTRAIRFGRMQPASFLVCSECKQARAREYHHYLGYEEPHWLDVKPLCIKCHRAAELVTQQTGSRATNAHLICGMTDEEIYWHTLNILSPYGITANDLINVAVLLDEVKPELLLS